MQVDNELKSPVHQEKRSATRPQTTELYGVAEVDGEFEVTLPGLEDPATGMLVGTYRERVSDRATAEKRVQQSREHSRIRRELASLDKTYAGDHFFNIKPTPDGRFKVTVPGGVDPERKFYLATTSFTFDTWDEAKAYFLNTVVEEEHVVDKSLLKLQPTSDTTIAFSELDAFHPRVAAVEQSYPIPPAIEQHLMSNGRLDGSDPSARTYRETIREAGWEKKLFTFIRRYLETQGAAMAKQLGITELEALSPKQAVDLATSIVIDLTKYKWSDTKSGGDIVSGQPSAADKNTVLQLLQEGLRRRSDPTWEGNGVCRNFASAVKAVFEALKANQTRFNRLRNTYALYEGDMDSFNPKRDDFTRQETNRVGHAWNSFVTVSHEGAANAVIVDATWAKRDLDSKKVVGLDHTLLRMEPIVRAVALASTEAAPQRPEQLKDILEYYVVKIEGNREQPPELPPVASLSSEEAAYYRRFAKQQLGEKYDLSQAADEQIVAAGQELYARSKHNERRAIEKQFFTSKAVELMTKLGVPAELPDSLVVTINDQYQILAPKADRSEIETVYRIAQHYPRIEFQKIFKVHLKEIPLSDYHADKLLFQDRALQRLVYEELKSRPGFDGLLKDSPKFRVGMRAALPELFLDFSPDQKPEDAGELRYLASQANGLRSIRSLLDRSTRPGQSCAPVFAKARELLRQVAPARYDADIASLDDYTVIKQFDQLAASLRA